jgi:hypothetical protein
VPFDLTLNLVWALLGAAALLAVFRTDLKHRVGSPFASRLFHFIRTGLVVAALFPYISATDDMLQIAQVRAELGDHEKRSGHHSNGHDRWRVFDSNESSVATSSFRLVIAFASVGIVIATVAHSFDSFSPTGSGRSPPVHTLS